MLKHIYLLWPQQPLDGRALREKLLGELAPQLLARAPLGLQMNIADDLATTPSPAPKPLGSTPFHAQINLWLDDAARASEFSADIEAAGFRIAGYRVDEWLYTDYGENPHAAARDWPDGERSPGILAVTLLRKPRRLATDEWMRRWFGWQSPMSEWMQPRSRYVRHVVIEKLQTSAESIEGIVEEDWPSGVHVTNPRLFYGAASSGQLIRHMLIMLRSVTRILNLWNITTVMCSEYFLKTPARQDRG